MKVNKLLAIVLSAVVLFPLTTIGTVKANANIVINGVDIGYAVGDYFTKNGKSCATSAFSNGTCHGHSICVNNTDSRCNCLRYWPSKSNKQVDLGGTQCFGFSRFCQWKVYGYHDGNAASKFADLTGSISASNCTASTLKSKLLGCASATHIRTKDGHSMAVVSTSGTNIKIVSCNMKVNGVKVCKIYSKEYTWSSFATYLSGRGGISYAKAFKGGSSTTPSPTPSPSGSVNPDNYTYPSRTLKYTSPTMKGEDVKWVQAVLCRLGYSVDIDGSYGKNSVAAIKRFQTDYKLTVDGYCGPATRAKLLELWNAKKHPPHTYGESYEAAHPHRIYKKCSCGDWYYTGGTKKLSSCSSCYPKPCGHSYDNLCDGICNLCGAYRSVSHSYSRRITKKATCATEGVLTNICIKCSYSYTSKIPATGNHTWKNGTCSVCKKTSTPVKITSQPKTAYACYGKKATITVAAKGDGLTYNWYIKNAGNKKYYKSSIKGNSYSQKVTNATNGRRVLCIVTDKYGNKVQSKTVLMRMKATITSQPKSATVANGKIAKITVGAKGDGLKYTWYIKNARGTKYIKSSVKTSTYSVRMTSAVNGRRLLCYVTDKYGNKVQTRTVILKKK